MKVTVAVDLTVEQMAAIFCEMDDEKQAQFFIECARISQAWETPGSVFQWHSVGRHLRTCSCSTDEAREMVQDIASASKGT